MRQMRGVPAALSAILLFASSARLAPASDPAADVMFRGNPRHTGVYGTGAMPTGSIELVYKWRFETGGKVRSTPAVSDGVVFVGSDDANLYAIDATSGRERWRVATGGKMSSSPAVVGNAVLFVGGDGHLHSVRAEDGKPLWTFACQASLAFAFTPGDPRLFDYYASSPTVKDGVAYFGSGDGHVYAVDAGKGTLLWKHDVGRWVRSTPAVDDGLVFVGTHAGDLRALDQKTGELRWRFESDGYPGYPPVVIASPAVADGTVYFASSSPNLYALDARTGVKIWRVEHPGSMIYSSPAIHAGVVFVGSSDAHIVQAVDAKTGVERWRHDTRARVLTSPAVADGVLYVGNTAAYLEAIALEDGKRKGQTFTEASIHSSAVVVGSFVYVGSDDNCLYAFERKLKP